MTAYDILGDGSTVAAIDAPDDSNQLPVHGVIIGEGDVTNGLSGKRTRWPGDVLEEMATDGLFEGKPITMADSLDPEQHVGVTVDEDGTPQLTGAVSMDEKVGEVTDTVYEDGVGLLFDGFVADWEAEETIESGLAQVSPVIMREVELVEGDADDPDALYEPADVQAARDLALVADGAAPSNDIAVGGLESAGDVAEALSAHFGVDVAGTIEALSVSKPTHDGYSTSAWDAPTLSGTFDGDLDAARNSATWVEDGGETFGDLSLFVVDGEGQLNTNGLDAAWRMASQTDGPTAEDVERLRSLYEDLAIQANDAGALSDDEFGDVWQDRIDQDIEAGASASAVDHRGGDDGPDDDVGAGDGADAGQSTPATSGWRQSMTNDDLSDKERELLAAAGQKDDPTVVEAEVLERLEALDEIDDELLDEATAVEDPVVTSEDDMAAMQERIDIVEEMMAEALQERTGLSDAAIDAMPFEAMAAEFQTDEGDLDVEALTQSPETGSGPTGGDGDTVTDEDRERIEEIDRKLDAMGSALPDSRAEALQEEAADLANADDYDAALEVL